MASVDAEDDGFVLVDDSFEPRSPASRYNQTFINPPTKKKTLVGTKTISKDSNTGTFPLAGQSTKSLSDQPTTEELSTQSHARTIDVPYTAEKTQLQDPTHPQKEQHLSHAVKEEIPDTPFQFRWTYQANVQYDARDPTLVFQVEAKKKRNRARTQRCPRLDAPNLGAFEHAWLLPFSETSEAPDASKLDTKPRSRWIPHANSADLRGFLTQEGLSVAARQFASLECNTALHFAAAEGCYGVVEYLLLWAPELGLGFVNARNAVGETPLEMAVVRGHAGIVRLLLEYGGDMSATGDSEPLVLKCVDADTMRCLVHYGADVNAVGSDGDSVLHRVCVGRWCYEEGMEMFRALGRKVDVDARNARGDLPYELLGNAEKRSWMGHTLWSRMSGNSRKGLKGPNEISGGILEELPFMFVSFMAGRC